MILDTAKAVFDAKRGEQAPPQLGPRLRLGQVVGTDPTPFILATGYKGRAPQGAESTVRCIGRISRPVPSVRLYVAEDAFYQIHQRPDGSVDECRYFSRFDTVSPADADEWQFWLAEADGMVGFPVFDTQDGARYSRVWSPGDTRIQPVRQVEDVETLAGTSQSTRDAMLYSRKLPGTEATEYLLLSVERGRGASVGLWAGLDVSPGALGL